MYFGPWCEIVNLSLCNSCIPTLGPKFRALQVWPEADIMSHSFFLVPVISIKWYFPSVSHSWPTFLISTTFTFYLFFTYYLSLNHSLFILSLEAVLAVKLQIWCASYIFFLMHISINTQPKSTIIVHYLNLSPGTPMVCPHALRNTSVKVRGSALHISLSSVSLTQGSRAWEEIKSLPLNENTGDPLLRHGGLFTLFGLEWSTEISKPSLEGKARREMERAGLKKNRHQQQRKGLERKSN